MSSDLPTPRGKKPIELFRDPRTVERVEDLPQWVKLALTRYVVEDITYAEAAKIAKKNASSLRAYANSPAGQEWLSAIQEKLRDPQEFARGTLKEVATNVLLDYFWAIETAKERGDHNAVRLAGQWLLERPELLGAVSKQETPQISITINGGSLEPITISSRHEEVKELTEGVDFEVEDDG